MDENKRVLIKIIQTICTCFSLLRQTQRLCFQAGLQITCSKIGNIIFKFLVLLQPNKALTSRIWGQVHNGLHLTT